MKITFDETDVRDKFTITNGVVTLHLDSKQAIDLAVQISKFFSRPNIHRTVPTANIIEPSLKSS
jgi:hypothetical protein